MLKLFLTLLLVLAAECTAPVAQAQPKTVVCPAAQITPYTQVERARPPAVVLVGGCFDVLHYGHIQFLKKSKKLGHYLVVALEPDARITTDKKRVPVHTQAQRAEILAQLRSVDEVVLLPELKGYEDYLALVKAVKPQYIAVTENDPQLINKQKQAKSVQATVVEVTGLTDGLSSTQVLEHAGPLDKSTAN